MDESDRHQPKDFSGLFPFMGMGGDPASIAPFFMLPLAFMSNLFAMSQPFMPMNWPGLMPLAPTTPSKDDVASPPLAEVLPKAPLPDERLADLARETAASHASLNQRLTALETAQKDLNRAAEEADLRSDQKNADLSKALSLLASRMDDRLNALGKSLADLQEQEAIHANSVLDNAGDETRLVALETALGDLRRYAEAEFATAQQTELTHIRALSEQQALVALRLVEIGKELIRIQNAENQMRTAIGTIEAARPPSDIDARVVALERFLNAFRQEEQEKASAVQERESSRNEKFMGEVFHLKRRLESLESTLTGLQSTGNVASAAAAQHHEAFQDETSRLKNRLDNLESILTNIQQSKLSSDDLVSQLGDKLGYDLSQLRNRLESLELSLGDIRRMRFSPGDTLSQLHESTTKLSGLIEELCASLLRKNVLKMVDLAAPVQDYLAVRLTARALPTTAAAEGR